MRGIRRLSATAACLVVLSSGSALAQEVGPPASPGVSPEASPNAERPLTHEELLAVRGELAGEDALMTLVAQTTIQRAPPPRQAAIGRRAAEGMGTLPRHGSFPGDPVVEATRVMRARYTPPADTDVAGLLAVHVTSDTLELRGDVATPAGSYLTPVTPEALALAEQLPLGALILARGALTQLTSEQPCPRLPDELRGAGFGGSPFAACQTGWLTAEPVSGVREDDPLTPTEFGIRVQAGARDYFWDRYDRPYETPTTYLLRHEANPLAEGQPSLGWQVIGRVDAVELPDEPTTLADAERPTGLDWQPVLERVPPSDTAGYEGAGPLLSTTWSGGFASVHQGRDRVLTSWVSADGKAWRSASLPTGIRQVDALLRLGHGLAIVADTTETDWDVRDWRFDVWRSDDGLEWRQVSRQVVTTPRRFADPADAYYRIVQGYWSLGDRIVAHETYTTARCCGRSTGTTFVAAAAAGTGKPVTFAWVSRDGRTWERRLVVGLTAAAGWHYRSRVHEGDRELVAFSETAGLAIDRSTDGVRWRTIGHAPKSLDHYMPMAYERTGAGHVLAGTASEPRDEDGAWGSSGVLWLSTDMERWVETDRPAAGFPLDLAVAGDTVVAVGGPSSGTGDPGDDAPPWLATSLDGGQTWDDGLTWAADEGWCLRSLTSDGSTVVLDVGCPPLDVASKYAVTLDAKAVPVSPAAGASVVTAFEALGCDDRHAVTGIREDWSETSGFADPEAAREAALAELTLIPRAGYEVVEEDEGTVLFAYRAGGEVKAAVRIQALDEAGDAWVPDGLAVCHVSELGDAPMAPGVWLWANRHGRAIHEIEGGPECSPGLRFLYLTDTAGVEGSRRTRAFVRDPEGDLRDRWRSEYRRGAALPRDARSTGYRRDGTELWMAADGDALYLVHDSDRRVRDVEQWPRIPLRAACA